MYKYLRHLGQLRKFIPTLAAQFTHATEVVFNNTLQLASIMWARITLS